MAFWGLAEGRYLQSGLAQAGGLTGNYDSSVQQYYSSFTLGLRMIQVAIGVTIGLCESKSYLCAQRREQRRRNGLLETRLCIDVYSTSST